VPGRFDLQGRGIVQPVQRRDVFVDTEGLVTDVRVKHGDMVQKGDVLVTLRNTDLDVRLADVQGQRRSVFEQLAAIRRMRHQANLPEEEKIRLGGQLLELEQRYRGLDMQFQLLMKKREQLEVRSPISGQVTTWNVDKQLLNRPVTKGQVLMTVANPDGPWEMEVYMPENRMGHITRARDTLGAYLPVEYVVATDPTKQCSGRIKSVNATAELHEEHGHAVWVLVDIDKSDLTDPRPGATTIAKVHCGHRPIGYVWLHEVYEFIQSRVLFNLGF